MPRKASLSSVCPVRSEDLEGSGSSTVPQTQHQGRRRRRHPSSCSAVQTASFTWTGGEERGGGGCWLCCPDSNEHTTVSGGKIVGNGFSAQTKMKAASRQVTVTAEKLNGDMKRRPSYPGELRAKHANMSTKIWVKVAMAIAYFLCVSVAAFILVIYYVFFWTPDPQYNSTCTEAQNRTDGAPRFG